MASETQQKGQNISRRNTIISILLLMLTGPEIIREVRNTLFSGAADYHVTTPTPNFQPTQVYTPSKDLDQIVQTPTPTKQPIEHYNFGAPWQPIVPGVYYFHDVIDEPVSIHNVVVDLLSPEVSLHNVLAHPGPYESLASIAERIPKAILAVNCDYPNTSPEGTNIEDYNKINFNQWRASLYCDSRGRWDIGIIGKDSLRNIRFAIGGGPIIMWENNYNFNLFNEGFERDILVKYENNRDAHTLLFLSEGRRYLLIVVYDGRNDQSIGMKPKEAVEYVNTLSWIWYKGMMCDGGQSSQLWVKLDGEDGKIVNNPINGGRKLSNALVIASN